MGNKLDDIPREQQRMTRVLVNYVDAQLQDGVPLIAVCIALETTLRHVETLGVIETNLKNKVAAARGIQHATPVTSGRVLAFTKRNDRSVGI
jgi:predicted oxidoreductase